MLFETGYQVGVANAAGDGERISLTVIEDERLVAEVFKAGHRGEVHK